MISAGLIATAILFAIPATGLVIWGGVWTASISDRRERGRNVTSGSAVAARLVLVTGLVLAVLAFIAALVAIWMNVAGL